MVNGVVSVVACWCREESYCEHTQRHCEWQKDRGTDLEPVLFRYKAFMTSLDVQTALDVAKPSAVSRLLAITDRGERVCGGGLAGGDFENCETTFHGGGSNTVKTAERQKYKQIVQWKRKIVQLISRSRC